MSKYREIGSFEVFHETFIDGVSSGKARPFRRKIYKTSEDDKFYCNASGKMKEIQKSI